MLQKPAEREVQRVQTNREELIERIERAMHADGVAQPLPGLHLARSSSPLGPVHGVFEPSLNSLLPTLSEKWFQEGVPLKNRHSSETG